MTLGRRRFLSTLAIAATVSLLPRQSPLRAAGERFLRIGTGPTGGGYFPVGALIANILSNPPGSASCDLGGSCGVPGVIAAAVASAGSVANLGDLADRTIDLAIAQADVTRDAVTGTAAFAGRALPQLRAIASLYTEALHVVVRRDGGLTALADLRGKRVSLAERESGTLVTARLVLHAIKLAEKDLIASFDPLVRAAGKLANHKLDAFFMVGGYPMEAIARLADSLPIALLSPDAAVVASLTTAASPLRLLVIPEGTYAGVGATPTLGPRALLLTTAAMDDDFAYAITRALWDPRNRRLFDTSPPISRDIRLAQALDGLTVPLHPGAFRYYREIGMKPAGER